MTDAEEKLEISEFNYKVLKGEYKHLSNEHEKLVKDYKQLLNKYEKRYTLYCEKVKDKVELQNELDRTNKELKEYKDKYVNAMNSYNATLLELEDLKKDNKEMNIETCVLAVLLFIVSVVLALG